MSCLIVLTSSIFFLLTTTLNCSHSLEIKPLPDGVFLTTGQDMRLTAMVWRVVVVLDRFTDVDIAHGATQLHEILQSLPRAIRHTIGTSTWNFWVRRIMKLKNTPPTTRPGRRYRRGAFNFLGDIAHAIMGVATEAEIEDLHDKVEQNRAIAQKTAHYVNELLTIVNASTEQIRRNNAQLDGVARVAQSLRLTVTGMYSNLTRELNALWVYNSISSSLLTLERAWDAIHASDTLHHQDRADLEGGRLTESILPPDLLRQIGREAQQNDPVELVRPLEWYYQHVFITPLWAESGSLAFKVDLPVVYRTPYLRYSIKTFEVPTSNMTTIELEGAGEFGFDSRTARIFRPVMCQGLAPEVCRQAPMFEKGYTLCPRSIIAGTGQDCNIKLTRSPQRVSLVTPIDYNQAVLTSFGEELSERCPGKAPIKKRIEAGAHLISIQGHCVLHGRGWDLAGIRITEKHQRIETDHLVIPFLNVSVRIPATLTFQPMPNLGYNTEVASVRLEPLHDIPDISWYESHQTPVTQLSMVSALGISVIFIVVFVVVGSMAYCKWKSLYYFKVPAATEPVDTPLDSKPSLEKVELSELPGTAGDSLLDKASDQSPFQLVFHPAATTSTKTY